MRLPSAANGCFVRNFFTWCVVSGVRLFSVLPILRGRRHYRIFGGRSCGIGLAHAWQFTAVSSLGEVTRGYACSQSGRHGIRHDEGDMREDKPPFLEEFFNGVVDALA